VADEHSYDEAVARRPRTESAAERARPAPLAWASAIGNSAVGRLLRGGEVRRSGSGRAVLDESIARAIHAKRGSGRELDPQVRNDLGRKLGDDFSDVRVHTDDEANALNHSVRAEAFTTGKDVFFRAGKYDPASNEGRKLIAHELTHVVQQRGSSPAGELTVSDPGDASERQASSVADKVAAPAPAPAPAPTLARAEAEDEEEVQTSPVARAETEEEEEVQTSPIARAEEEEEEVQTSPVAREEAEEEEVQTSPVAREEAEEEETQA
jgi:hypothetical protein